MNVRTTAKIIILSLFSTTLILSSELFESVRVEKNKVTVVINKKFKNKFLRSDFFVEYDNDVDLSALDYSLVTMPCLMNVISLVWISGENYYIHSMDRDLYQSLQRIKKLFVTIYPKTRWNGNLIPRKIVVNSMSRVVTPDNYALLFSGGLDSTTASLLHRDKKQLLITGWGQSDLPLHRPDIWNIIKNKIATHAKNYGHTLTIIRSNYCEFLNTSVLNTLSSEILDWRIGAIEDIGWAGLTAPLLFVKGYPMLGIASSITWDRGYPIGCFPFIDSNLICAGIKFEQVQPESNRADKVEFLVDLCRKEPVKKPELIVCQKQRGVSCGSCKKCIHTALMLLILKENPQEYGFPVTKDHVLKTTELFLDSMLKESSLKLDGIEPFYMIQNKIKELTAKGICVDPQFASVINFDFHKEAVRTNEYKYQKRLEWNELHLMFPHVKIPAQYLGKKS
ncbi:hypothetical protein H0X06_05340 [Candidatus Dependentiae bacterium]|nr:hypothetical protein [Candidatus Dependentiae bacterium]